MRCLCCNANLSNRESVLRHPVTNEFLDTCGTCLKYIPINPVEPTRYIEENNYDEEAMFLESYSEEEDYIDL